MYVRTKKIYLRYLLLIFAVFEYIPKTGANTCDGFFDQYSPDRPRLFIKNHVHVESVYEPGIHDTSTAKSIDEVDLQKLSIVQYCGKIEVIAGDKVDVQNYEPSNIPFTVSDAKMVVKSNVRVIVKAPLKIFVHGVPAKVTKNIMTENQVKVEKFSKPENFSYTSDTRNVLSLLRSGRFGENEHCVTKYDPQSDETLKIVRPLRVEQIPLESIVYQPDTRQVRTLLKSTGSNGIEYCITEYNSNQLDDSIKLVLPHRAEKLPSVSRNTDTRQIQSIAQQTRGNQVTYCVMQYNAQSDESPKTILPVRVPRLVLDDIDVSPVMTNERYRRSYDPEAIRSIAHSEQIFVPIPKDVDTFLHQMEDVNKTTVIIITKPVELYIYGELEITQLTEMAYRESRRFVPKFANVDVSFIVKVTGTVAAMQADLLATNNSCGLRQEVQRSICAQMDHNFYRFDVRVNNPFYSQCVTRHLSADLQSIEIEIWLVRHFIRNQCPQDQNDCVTQFVKNILRDPPGNLPTLPFTLDAQLNNLRVEVLHTGQMNTACRQLQMGIQYLLPLLVLLHKIIFC